MSKDPLHTKLCDQLGVEFDPSQAEKVLEISEHYQPIPLHCRPDGSITNW